MNMTTVPSDQLKAMQQEITDLKEQVAQLKSSVQHEADCVDSAAAEINHLKILIEEQNAELASITSSTVFKLKSQISHQEEAIRLKDAALEKIACIGNGDTHGNSVGNCLAIDALAIQPSPEILQAKRFAEAIRSLKV